MTEEVIGEISQGAGTPAAPEVPQGEQPQSPEQAPEQNTQADPAEHPDDDHKVPKGVQKRIDRLTRERYRLQGELDAMRRQQTQAPAPQQSAQAEGAPTPDQFQSYEQYLEAKAEWKAEQKVQQVLRQQQEEGRRRAEQDHSARAQQEWEKQLDTALDRYDDFEEVALSPEVPISDAMAQAMKYSAKGADVAYYLGKNREVAAQIARLDPLSAAIRIGEIAATLTLPQAKRTTNAPAPITPVGARAAVQKDPAKMSDAEFAAWRRDQIKRRS